MLVLLPKNWPNIGQKRCNDEWKEDILRTGKKINAKRRLGTTALRIMCTNKNLV